MKYNLISGLTLSLSVLIISCTNPAGHDSATRVDSTVVVKADSVPAETDTLAQEMTLPAQTTATTVPAPTEKAQKGTKTEDPTCSMPLTPSFPEGEQAMRDFIEEHLQYPDAAKKANVSGKVTVGVKVKSTGELTDIKILKGLGYGCDEEAIRIVKSMPPWIPGKYLNKPMDADYRIEVDFKLN